VGLGLGVTVGAGVFMATGKASEEAGPAPWTLNFSASGGDPQKLSSMGTLKMARSKTGELCLRVFSRLLCENLGV